MRFIFRKFLEYAVRKLSKWVNMANQVKVGKQETEGRAVIRNYQSRFSCMEAVERLVQIHSSAREESDGKEKSQILSA